MGTIREYIKKNGETAFHAEVRLKGHLPQREHFRTKSKAKEWIQDIESAIRDGRYSNKTEARRRTVGDMVDRFIEQWLPRFPGRQAKQTALLTWWKQQCGHLRLIDFSSAKIAEYRDKLANEKVVRGNVRSPSTVNRYLSALGKALNVCMKEWAWIDDTPMRKVSRPKEASSRDRFLDPEEKERLLQECRSSKHPFLYPLVALSLITAMRSGELINLCWQDVDFRMRKIILRNTKNGDPRIVPLTSEAEAIFREIRTDGANPQELIFSSRRNSLNQAVPVSVRGSFALALKRAGIENFRWHDLRHTAASYLAMAGASQAELMAILGHRSPIMTKRYVHFTQRHLADLMQRTSKEMILKEIGDDHSNIASPSTHSLRLNEESRDSGRDSAASSRPADGAEEKQDYKGYLPTT